MNNTKEIPDWEKEFIHKFVNDHGDEWRPLRGLWVEDVIEFISQVHQSAYEKGVKEERERILEIISKLKKTIYRHNPMETAQDSGYNKALADLISAIKEEI
jgi:hypothetical protein